MYNVSKPSNNLSSEQRFCLAKAIFVLICLTAFVGNSFMLFSQFIEGSTILSNDLITPKSGMLEAPSILVCGKKSFKSLKLDTKISDFEENSLRLEEFLVSSLLMDGNYGNMSYENVSDKWITFYTAFFGSCHKLELEVMVRLI